MPPASWIIGDAAISYLAPLIAVVVGIVHAALAPVLVIGGVKPNLLLVAVVLATALVGFGPGIILAFVAGLTANLLVGDALGSVPLAMLLVAALVAGGVRIFGRLSLVYPVLAVLVGSVVADVVTLSLGQLVGDAPLLAGVPADLVVSAAILNAAIAALLVYPTRLLVRRWSPDEATAW